MVEFKKNRANQEFQYRHFLNGIESSHTGSLKLDFTVRRTKNTSKKNPGYKWHLHGGMEIRDCSRRIDLTFDGDTKNKVKELKNSREKLEKIKLACEKGLMVINAMEQAAAG